MVGVWLTGEALQFDYCNYTSDCNVEYANVTRSPEVSCTSGRLPNSDYHLCNLFQYYKLI